MNKIQEQLKKITGIRVAKARATMNYSQVDVLNELERYGLGRTQGSLSQIERGKRLPSVEMLYVLAKYLETSTDYLLGLTDNELSAADISEDLHAWDAGGKFARIMNQLLKDQQQQVISFAEYLWASRRNASATLPAPNNGRTREEMQAEIVAILDSVERHYGVDERRRLERIGLNKTGAVNASV